MLTWATAEVSPPINIRVKFATLSFFPFKINMFRIKMILGIMPSHYIESESVFCHICVLKRRMQRQTNNSTPPKCVRQSPAAPGVPVVFCGTPQLSWQPSRSLPKDDRPQRSQSMMHAVLGATATAGTVSPEEEEGCHTKIFLYVRSVYH